MQLYFFKDSFTIHLIKAGKRNVSWLDLRKLLEFPFSVFILHINNFLQNKVGQSLKGIKEM